MAAMAGHSVICREATPDERAEIAAQLKVAWGAYGCLMLFAAFAVGALGGVAGWIAERISADAGAVGRWTGWVIGGVLWVWLLIRCVREERRRRRGLLQEAAEGRVQQVSVTDPRVVSLEAVTESDPALVFDIGEGRLLLLQGNWLYDEKTYGAPPVEDEHEDFLNGLPPPHSFPSTTFTIVRLPHSGNVLSIDVKGAYLPAMETVHAIRPELLGDFRDSELLRGSLDDLATVLGAEHASRRSSIAR